MMRTIAPARRAALRLAITFGLVAANVVAPAGAGSTEALIIRAPGRGAGVAAAAVADIGGVVTYRLPIVDGVAATVPAGSATALQRRGLDVSADRQVQVFASSTGTGDATPTMLSEIGADRLQAKGIDGDATRTVALVDTGVTTRGIPDLEGRLVPITDDLAGPLATPQPCLDLSGEQSCDDTFGHGTFMAGLIAGSGAASGGAYRGVAPGTRIVSIKIAGVDGSSDVSKVLAAIQFVVSFKDRYGIRVLNLSLGTDSKQDPRVDPLNLAVERAWDAGITAVVSAGNLGPGRGTVTKPGDDPLVITVGASDDRSTPAISDDYVPLFSGQGAPGFAKPDVVAPGTKLISVLPVGSTIDNALRAKGSPGIAGGYRRASGTSMSAAVTSGAAALLADSHPEWTPGQVKTALLGTTHKVGLSDPLVVGKGQIDVAAATTLTAPGDANAGLPRGDGSGTLDAARGSLIVRAVCTGVRASVDANCGQEIRGENNANGQAYDEEEFTGTSWYGTSWYTSQWYGTSWYGTSWYGTSWYGTSWYGTSWYGTSWYSTEASQGSSWDGNSDATVLGIAPPGSRLYGLWR